MATRFTRQAERDAQLWRMYYRALALRHGRGGRGRHDALLRYGLAAFDFSVTADPRLAAAEKRYQLIHPRWRLCWLRSEQCLAVVEPGARVVHNRVRGLCRMAYAIPRPRVRVYLRNEIGSVDGEPVYAPVDPFSALALAGARAIARRDFDALEESMRLRRRQERLELAAQGADDSDERAWRLRRALGEVNLTNQAAAGRITAALAARRYNPARRYAALDAELAEKEAAQEAALNR